MLRLDIALLNDRLVDLLAVLSCSLLPVRDGPFIQSVRLNNRLNGTSIAKQTHHDDHQIRWRA